MENKITLPWHFPGHPIEKKKEKLKFDFLEWEDTRDLLWFIGAMALSQSTINKGSKLEDYKIVVILLAKSMWNIQDYASKKLFDPVAMEARVIVEAVCTYILGERPINLGEAIHKITQMNKILSKPLRILRDFGCTGVHLENNSMNNKITRTDENTALAIIQTVFDVLILIRDDIIRNHKFDADKALKKLCENRKRVSSERMSLESRNINKKKSCADESKIEGCCRINLGCPYLHKDDDGFDINESKKYFEIINNFKKKKSKKTNIESDEIVSKNINNSQIISVNEIEKKLFENKNLNTQEKKELIILKSNKKNKIDMLIKITISKVTNKIINIIKEKMAVNSIMA